MACILLGAEKAPMSSGGLFRRRKRPEGERREAGWGFIPDSISIPIEIGIDEGVPVKGTDENGA